MINRFRVEIIIEANGFTDVWVGTKRMKIILSLMGPRKLSYDDRGVRVKWVSIKRPRPRLHINSLRRLALCT